MSEKNILMQYNEDSIFAGFDFNYDKWNLILEALSISIRERDFQDSIFIKNKSYKNQKILIINKFRVQVYICSHFDEDVNISINPWIKNKNNPHLLLAAQVDDENNIVYFPGVITGNEFNKLLIDNKSKDLNNIKIPISDFDGGVDLLFNIIKLIDEKKISKIFIDNKIITQTEKKFKNNNIKVSGSIIFAGILSLIFIPKIYQPRLALDIKMIEGTSVLIADNTRSIGDISNKLCVLSPQLKTTDNLNQYKYYISIDKPVLLFKDSLNEIMIIKDNKEIWRKTATSDNKIIGPLYWPIKSFEVNDSYILRVRPDGIPMGNYADIKLEASKDKITKLDQLENSLDKNEYKWIREINKNISKNPDLSIALLFSKNIPNSEVLEKTKKTIIFDSNCD